MGVAVYDGEGGGGVAGCARGTVGGEGGVKGGDEVGPDEAVEGLPAVD